MSFPSERRVATIKITIKNILLLAQNWEQLKAMNSNLSQYKIGEVEKNAPLSRSRDPKYGFLTYKCAKCDPNKTIPLACTSRICPQCGKNMADQSMSLT
ncbi:MAG: transposase zinc-binding domain-containing protein [Nitrososphaerota archaeon]|nr:transposase zinc-binding domain-containing protein [Nitrososphaerota archaeon]